MARGGGVLVAGAGVAGVTAARALRARGHAVTLLDPGPLPHPLAASTDVSKAVRLEYGADGAYTALGERALEGWRRFNADEGERFFHETGVLFLRRGPMVPGGFEHDSHTTLVARGHRPERLDHAGLGARFPAWGGGGYTDGFFHALGGWVESGRALARWIARASREGVALREGASLARVEDGDGASVTVALRDGQRLTGDSLVLALGAWTPWYLTALAPALRSTGHPVFHLRPREPERFTGERFPVFGAAIAETGWYGFPLHPTAGVVKIARHGVGRAMHPEDPARAVTDEERAALGEFLAGSLPWLADAAVVSTRVCLYCDTHDGHFWIDRDPSRPRVVVAAGDSGHGYKFAPVLGDWIADVVEGAPAEPRWRWRPEVTAGRTEEAARRVDDGG
ncbi:MAG: FAD-dependent oxidoreductase [Deltaproteobacteria bacterium]|nr:FAD-dependent oxidoreductase [Deltaproteobacteria bacterium]